MKKLGII